jgi:hypothetical protein
MSIGAPSRRLYLSLDSSDEMGVLLRDLTVMESDGPDGDRHPASERVQRITIDLREDAATQMDIQVLGSNGLPAHVKANVYELRVAGYPHVRAGRGADAVADVLATLRGLTPGAEEPALTREDALRAAQVLAAWARR